MSSFDSDLAEWLGQDSDRRIEVTHGGHDGSYYAKIVDEEGDSFDGVGSTMMEAAREAWAAMVE